MAAGYKWLFAAGPDGSPSIDSTEEPCKRKRNPPVSPVPLSSLAMDLPSSMFFHFRFRTSAYVKKKFRAASGESQSDTWTRIGYFTPGFSYKAYAPPRQ